MVVEGMGDEKMLLDMDRSVVECELFHEVVEKVDWIGVD